MNASDISKIVIQGLPFHAFHGVYLEEHVHGTAFRADVTITLRNGMTCFQDDKIENALNYEQVIQEILAIATQQQFQLIERLAEACAESVLAHKEAAQVDVTIHKRVSGITEEPLWVAVSISRTGTG